jgi:Xaa-Pro aminopeptidase
LTEEILEKLRQVRSALAAHDLAAVRFRGVDWFSWATAGGSSVVILTAETGVAEVLITREEAWILTNAIESARLREEEVPSVFEIHSAPWASPESTEAFVAGRVRGGRIASDRPRGDELPLPEILLTAKRTLLASEVERYRKLGKDAAEAMTEALIRAEPQWTENELAGQGARALASRGIHPTLTLVGGESRVSRHRHPFPSSARLGRRAMLVFCGRRHGLYANLTRFVYFEKPTEKELALHRDVAAIEAAAWQASAPGTRLSDSFHSIVNAYERLGHAEEHLKHHQGGTTGYLSREAVATSETHSVLLERTALAWNPSLPGAKIEDTSSRLLAELKF